MNSSWISPEKIGIWNWLTQIQDQIIFEESRESTTLFNVISNIVSSGEDEVGIFNHSINNLWSKSSYLIVAFAKDTVIQLFVI